MTPGLGTPNGPTGAPRIICVMRWIVSEPPATWGAGLLKLRIMVQPIVSAPLGLNHNIAANSRIKSKAPALAHDLSRRMKLVIRGEELLSNVSPVVSFRHRARSFDFYASCRGIRQHLQDRVRKRVAVGLSEPGTARVSVFEHASRARRHQRGARRHGFQWTDAERLMRVGMNEHVHASQQPSKVRTGCRRVQGGGSANPIDRLVVAASLRGVHRPPPAAGKVAKRQPGDRW